MYYIEENNNLSIIDKIFKIIKIQDNKVIIPIKDDYKNQRIATLKLYAYYNMFCFLGQHNVKNLIIYSKLKKYLF